jgi:hypothetical protein
MRGANFLACIAEVFRESHFCLSDETGTCDTSVDFAQA